MKNIAIATTLTIGLSATTVFAQDIIDQILQGEEYENAEILETKNSFFGIKVVSVLPDGTTIIRHYRKNGSLRSQVSTDSEGNRQGTVYATSGEEIDVSETVARVNNDDDSDVTLDGCGGCQYDY